MLKRFDKDIAGGVVLLMAAVAALLVVNLGGAGLYHAVLETPIGVGGFTKSLRHWINDGLMVLFFIVVGIEIHREFRVGALRDRRQAMVPLAAAAGGFVLPALVYLAWVAGSGQPELVRGWSIASATDIAFAVALVTMLRAYVPASLRVFLLTLAVADDLYAILVIALFYTQGVVWHNLFLAGALATGLFVKNRLGVRVMWVYVLAGIGMWLLVLESGVHATLAGVILGFLLPLKGKKGQASPAEAVEHALAPVVRWGVLPLFAFANVGVDLRGLGWEQLVTPLTLGIALGLLVGKQLGVLASVWAMVRLGFAKPKGADWRQVYGVACLCGIGFTMSLFIAALSLAPEHQAEVRVGVLAGSVVSALMGVMVLRWRR